MIGALCAIAPATISIPPSFAAGTTSVEANSGLNAQRAANGIPASITDNPESQSAFVAETSLVFARPTHSQPTTQFQCEKRYYQAQSRTQCFNQLPGANCAHPLEAQKAEQTTRGAHRYFKITFKGERDGEGLLETYTYAPTKNVGICPHGVAYIVSLEANREHCERTSKGEEYCSSEYDTKTIPEPTTRAGGEFEYIMPQQPVTSGHLVVKGYFIHPPWDHHS
jgi:hypothetical protein